MTVPGYPTDECPSTEALNLFIRLELDDEQCQTVRRHVEHCTACQAALDRASNCGVAIGAVRSTNIESHSSTVDRLVKRLCDHIPLDSYKRESHLPISFEPADDGVSLGRLNRFLIRRELASGATGTVFEALDTLTDRSLAIKFIRSSDPQTVRRVEREARATSKVNHPAVVSIQSVETAPDGRLFLVMPLVAGRSLAEMIQDTKSISFEEIVGIILQVAEGLAEVHRQGLLHRDIKPANIVVDSSGETKLTDFGLASFVEEESTLTESGVILGTPTYMSPEQARNLAHIDGRSDIYSLGATLYECLTGTRPFRGQIHEVLRQIVEREPVRPQLINPMVPSPLEAICLKAMSKSLSGRYATIQHFIDDLRRWQKGQTVLARLPGPWSHITKWVRREPKFAVAIATTAATLMGGIGFSWHYWNRSNEQTRLAASRFDASLNTIHVLSDLSSQSLSGDPGLASIRKQVQAMADKAFEPLVNLQPNDAANLVRYLKAMDSLGTIKHSVTGPVEALAFRQKIANDNLPIWKDYQHEDSVRREWANLQLRLAVCHIELREFPLATEALDRAENLLREQDPNDRLLIARVKHSRGTLHKWIDNNNASAAPEFRRAVELAKLYAVAFPNDKLALATANNSQGWLADCETQLGNLDLAETLMREVYDNYTALTNTPEPTYSVRLEKGRAAFALMNLLITRGQIGPALEWSKQVEPEIRLLQASNPTLMETDALKIGFDCHIVSAQIHNGDFETAMQRANIALTQASQLEQRFPNTTRTWQVHGHAKQMWFIAAMHVADYGGLKPFLEDWIEQIDLEIQQQKNVGFNQQLKLSLLMNLAVAVDWNGEASVASPIWKQVIELAPNEQKPAYKLLSQIAQCRASLQKGESLTALGWDSGHNRSLELVTSLNQGMPYPSGNHLMAEAYAVSAHLLMANQRLDDSTAVIRTQMEQYQQTAKGFLQTAHTTGFYRLGDRLMNFRNDPVFADEAYQSIVVE